MKYWLIKSEPSVYSWEQLLKDGKTGWEGVRNYAARNNLREMKKGDQVFYYHSNEGLAIVGIAKVVKEAYQDPTSEDPAWLSVDFEPVKTLKNPVPIKLLKDDPSLKEMALLRISRLSVQPVTKEEWNRVLKFAK